MKLPAIEVVDETTGRVCATFPRLPGLRLLLTALTRRANRWGDEIGWPERYVVRRSWSSIGDMRRAPYVDPPKTNRPPATP